MMKRTCKLLVTGGRLPGGCGAGTGQVGMVVEMSGPFADIGRQIMNGARAYVKAHGDTVAGRRVELVVKDTTGMAPDPVPHRQYVFTVPRMLRPIFSRRRGLLGELCHSRRNRRKTLHCNQ
ncbi:MAG: ABC transporter substrate-binding protein [Burkholderiales bacterium]